MAPAGEVRNRNAGETKPRPAEILEVNRGECNPVHASRTLAVLVFVSRVRNAFIFSVKLKIVLLALL
jgi:hypothetical protein